MRASFGMNRNQVATCIGEGLQIGIAGAIIKCASKNAFVRGRIVFTTCGPKVMFGTK